MRATAVSFEDVRNAFFEVLAEGGNPTFEAIYTKIGRRGGADVVRKLIAEVKTEAANLHEKLTLSRMPGVPDPSAVTSVLCLGSFTRIWTKS